MQSASYIRIICTILITCLTPTYFLGYGQLHFFHSNRLWNEPRFERTGLSSLTADVRGGHTWKSFDCHSSKQPLLSIYGPHALAHMTKNIASVPGNKPFQAALDLLASIPQSGTFGLVDVHGSFGTTETTITVSQNIKHGFFTRLYVPFYHLNLDNISFKDLTSHPLATQELEAAWSQVFNNLSTICSAYNFSLEGFSKTDMSDMVWTLGWTKNYDLTTHLDFVDATLEAGILLPTAPRKNSRYAFDITAGYNGHVGFPLTADFSIGAFDWLTLGVHGHFLFFAPALEEMRLKTAQEQNGFILLARDCVKIYPGMLMQLGAFAKADHIVKGLSFTLGYSGARKSKDSVHAVRQVAETLIAFANDKRFEPWSMHTLHFLIDYDFSHEYSSLGARIGFSYDLLLKAQNAFKLSCAGFVLGLDYVWDF